MLEHSGFTQGKAIRETFMRRIVSGAALAAVVLVTSMSISGTANAQQVVGEARASAGVGVARLDPVRVPGTAPLGRAAVNLKRYGYAEREFYASGKANRYSGAVRGALTTAAVVDRNHPYKTRVLVRYPVNPRKFNGTLLVEWQNVTVGQDIDFTWAESHEFLMKQGYAFAVVSAQNVGVNHLRAWSPARYGSLSITADPTDDGDADVLSWDIFGQVSRSVEANRGPQKPLPGLRVKHVVALGESQSAGRLSIYYNTIQPIHNFFDGFVYYDGVARLRTDLSARVVSVTTEFGAEYFFTPPPPDSKNVRIWDVAGTSHVSVYGTRYVDRMVVRDRSLGGSSLTQLITSCETTPLWSKVDTGVVLDTAVDSVNRWIQGRHSKPAPRSIRFQRNADGTLARDAAGRVIGGVRLPDFNVPTAKNLGSNVGPGFCFLAGSHRDYSRAELKARYGSHRNYVAQVERSLRLVKHQGYVVRQDARLILKQARNSNIGR